jgi:hypothetical protein
VVLADVLLVVVFTTDFGASATAADASEVATAVPFLFEARTVARSVAPTSIVTGAYARALAPEIGMQFEPAVLQRCH